MSKEGSGANAATVDLVFDGKTYTYPVIEGSEGEKAIDISALRKDTGMITLDTGYGNTGSCKSSITFINGEEGILQYRGYPIAELAEHSSFLETSWLLLYGELPDKGTLEKYVDEVTHHTMLHEDYRRFFDFMPKSGHPMPVASAACAALSAFYDDATNDDELHANIVRLIAKLPTIAAFAYKHSIGQPKVHPRNDLDYSSNFLNMMFSTPCEEYQIDPVISRAIDMLLILHADHEQNCSTSTVRLVGSSQAGLFATIAAGISALWGPLHGGANQKVCEMLEDIAHRGLTVQDFMNRAKDKKDDARLMGFGHRVYKNYDPRAAILKTTCRDVIGRVGGDSQLLDIAMQLEEIALSDDYFVKRNLYPNVDFYSGVIYKAIGIPVDMYTVLFTMGRLPGWIAQWKEMRNDPLFRIGRPRQIYTGATKRAYVPVDQRG